MIPEPADGAAQVHSQLVGEGWDDLLLATTIAQVAQRLPGVRALSAGCFATIATYGPGGHVPGVVLRRAELHTLTVEVNVVASEDLMLLTLHRRGVPASQSLPEPPFLLSLAERVRSSVQQMVAPLPLAQRVTVDVVIEDLR